MRRNIITIPNALSLFRIVLIPCIVKLFLNGDGILAACVLLLSAATDILDGFIARTFHMTSDLGKVLDPIADKLTLAAVVICLLTRFPLMTLPLALLALKEVFMAVTGAMIIKRTGIVLGAHWHGKAATVLLYAAILLHLVWFDILPLWSRLAIGAASLMVLASFVLYIRRNMGYLRKGRCERT